MSSGYDWEAKTSKWGIKIFSSVWRSHDEVLAAAFFRNSEAEDIAFLLLDIFAVLRNAYVLESGNACECANRVCPPLDGLESVHLKFRSSQAQSSVQRAKQRIVNQADA